MRPVDGFAPGQICRVSGATGNFCGAPAGRFPGFMRVFTLARGLLTRSRGDRVFKSRCAVSISSVGSAHSQAYLHRPSQTDNVEGGDTGPTVALQSLYQDFTGRGSSDPLIPGLGSENGTDGSSGLCGALQFSAAAMSALLSVQGGQDKASPSDAEP